MNRKKIFLFAGLFLAMNLEASDNDVTRGVCHSKDVFDVASKPDVLQGGGASGGPGAVLPIDVVIGARGRSHSPVSRGTSVESVSSRRSGSNGGDASGDSRAVSPTGIRIFESSQSLSGDDSAVAAHVPHLDSSERHYTLVTGLGRQLVRTDISYNPETHSLVKIGYKEEVTVFLNNIRDSLGLTTRRSVSPLSLAKQTDEEVRIKAEDRDEESWGFRVPDAICGGAGDSKRPASPKKGLVVSDFSGRGSTNYTPSKKLVVDNRSELKAGMFGLGLGLSAASLAAYLTRK